MSDVHAQIVAVIAGIRAQTAHHDNCASRPAPLEATFTRAFPCNCSFAARVDAEIARRWEASVNAAIPKNFTPIHANRAVAAALRGATEENE